VNLLSNAIKYNNEAGTVTVSAKRIEQDFIELKIIDTGVGIKPEDQEVIFQPFTRLTYATEQEIQGTGIGLTLTKFLVEQMNGEIYFNSSETGSIFYIRFPQGKAID